MARTFSLLKFWLIICPREHEEEEDALRQKYHQDAVDGKFRAKRRGGVSMDDSDSDGDGEDYESKRLREKMNKKRKIEGDTLEDLGKLPSFLVSSFSVRI